MVCTSRRCNESKYYARVRFPTELIVLSQEQQLSHDTSGTTKKQACPGMSYLGLYCTLQSQKTKLIKNQMYK